MSDGIYSALAGAIAQERTLAVVANNVANVNTTGFQGDKVAFSEIAAKQLGARPQPLRFVSLDQTRIDLQSGGLEHTGNPLDLALQGDAYFAVQAPGGERYTRAGAFVTDGEGVLRTHGGLEVLGDGGTLSIPQGTKNIRVAPNGSIHADGQEVGRLKIVKFQGTEGLTRDGLTLLAAGANAVPMDLETENVTVAQGYLDSANVNAVAGMNELITVSRSFDALQKVIDGFKQIDERTARDLGGR
jgi:flagellar basal-body rod protein FlgF